jgi:Flp pilus assembly protein TadD/NAD-dependent dihydropyrimidine dehydrogenase PreA subunit
MLVWPTAYRLFLAPNPGPLVPAFTNHLLTDNFWETFPSVAVAIPFLFICGFVTVYFLGMKGFCTYACPYGGFFALADKLAPAKIRVTDACNQCGHCTATCTSNVLVHAEVKQYGMVVDPGCMKCMDCISVCPNNALYYGFGKPTFAVARSKRKTVPRNYSLSGPEEVLGAVVFLGGFLAVRSVYGLVPFLMALGCAAVTTFLTLKAWRLITAPEVYFHRFHLKSAGRLQKMGWTFIVSAIVWIGLTAHSGVVRYHESQGDRAFQKITVPDELALAQSNPASWLPPADRETILAGAKHLRVASRYGFFRNSDALSKLAWFDYLSGDVERSVDLLGQAAEGQKGRAKALSFYYRGAILNRLGRFSRARASLDQALAERDDLILARQEKGESLWLLGHKDEAIAVWTDAVQRNSTLALTNNQLAGAKRALGRLKEAAAHEKQADRFTPDNAAYHWMLGLRLRNVGMEELAGQHFERAMQLDPRFADPPKKIEAQGGARR